MKHSALAPATNQPSFETQRQTLHQSPPQNQESATV